MAESGGDSDEDLLPELVQPNKIDEIIAVLEKQRIEIDKDLYNKMNAELTTEMEKRNELEKPLLKELNEIQKTRKDKLRQLRAFQENFKTNMLKCKERREKNFLRFKDLQRTIEKNVTFS
tara:strand:+ start:1003 stop:1362 length:360 start_codon:yes stop_codon:yes gene_type:complete